MANDTVQFLHVDLLQPNPFQPRNKIKDTELQELSESIKQYGVLEPLIVAHTPAGYQIIAGERRWRASRLAELTEVPVLIKKTTRKEMLEMAIIENVQRVNLSPMERAQAFLQLQRDFNYTVSEVAEKVSKSTSYISNSLKLLTLPDAVKDGLVGNIITEGHARAISGIEDSQAMVDVYKRILKESASVRRAEELARLYKESQPNPKTRLAKGVLKIDDKQVEKWEQILQKHLKAKSKIKLTRSAKQTRITITLKGDPHETQKDLEYLMDLSKKGS